MASVDNDTKARIQQRINEGWTVDQIKTEFPTVPGKVINGMKNMGNLRTGRVPVGMAADPGFAPAGAPTATAVAPPVVPPPPTSTPLPMTPERANEAVNLGFTPVPNSSVPEGGFTSAWQDHFVIKRLDGPEAGVVGQEYPPFNIQTFMNKYKAGTYDIVHYRNGRAYNHYRESISPLVHGPGQVNGSGLTFQNVPQNQAFDPTRMILEAVNMVTRLNHDVEDRVNREQARRTGDEATGKQAEMNVASAAITGMTGLFKEVLRPDPGGGSMSQLLALMNTQQQQTSENHKNQMEIMNKRFEQERLLERERIAAERTSEKERLAAERQADKEHIALDRERMNKDSDERIAREREYLTKLAELDAKKQEMFTNYYNKSVEDLRGYQEGIKAEFDRARQQALEYAQMARAHTEEVIQLKKAAAGTDKDLDKWKLVVQAIQSVGGHIESVFQKMGNAPQGKGILGGVNVVKKEDKAPDEKKAETVQEAPKMSLDIDEMLKGKFFQDLQEEIFLQVKAGKPGNLMAQVFWDAMQTSPPARAAFVFMSTRSWDMILKRCAGGIRSEFKELFESPAASKWYDTFIATLNQTYEAFLKAAEAIPDEPKKEGVTDEPSKSKSN